MNPDALGTALRAGAAWTAAAVIGHFVIFHFARVEHRARTVTLLFTLGCNAPEDRILLSGRATARGMPSATYVSVLVRSHLRNLAPLPKEELLALKRSVAELGLIGRNLNQIARTANQGGKPAGPGREDLRAMLKAAEGLRDHVKALLKANQISWEQGHAETTH